MNNQNNGIIFVNQNQKILVDKIIEFYKKSGRIFMNYNEKNQIKQLLNNLNTNYPLLKEGNDIADPLPYINEKKKLIKFINHDFKMFNVKVPISIDKQTLYAIASLFKSFGFSKFLLVYMNCILYEDESSIDSISDGDFITIIENLYYLDDSYLNSLNIVEKRSKNVPIKMNGQYIRNMIVPDNIKLSQIYKALIFHFGCHYYYYYMGDKLREENLNFNKECIEGYPIELSQSNYVRTYFTIFGKEIILNTKFKDINGTVLSNFSPKYSVGTLNSIKELVKIIEIQTSYEVKAFYLDRKQINFEVDKSFSSLGINKDSQAIIFVNKK